MLVSQYAEISYIDWPTPTAAARWKIASAPATARLSALRSRTSPSMTSTSRDKYEGKPEACTCLLKLSKTVTEYPCCNRASAVWEPTNPHPPMIRTRFIRLLLRKSQVRAEMSGERL